jgi:hypothetical protein
LPNAREVGLKLVLAWVPVPDRATFCGLAGALSVKVKLAVRLPVVPGVNVTLTTQLAFTAIKAPQVLAEIVKSAAFVPVSATDESVVAAVPGFDTVTERADVGLPTV